ncbi:MAG: hypothetical protein EKK46_17940 [Rhodocyclaceae bacterium]|nr:MAG: hypothetical protein EKK46_17940 [Rhodocyclaceae bacterium]
MTSRDLRIGGPKIVPSLVSGQRHRASAALSAIVLAAEIGHPDKDSIALLVNDGIKQSLDLSLQIHSVADLIAHLSQLYHLQPGDPIYFGTSESVGLVVTGDKV